MKKSEKLAVPGGVELSRSEVEDAKKEGALDYVKEGAKGSMAADTGTTGDPEQTAQAEALRMPADLNTTPLEPLLNLSLDVLVPRLTNEKVEGYLPLDSAQGLLALERAGRNRTAYVEALCKRIGVKSPYEVTHAGPAFTNDVSSTSAVKPLSA